MIFIKSLRSRDDRETCLDDEVLKYCVLQTLRSFRPCFDSCLRFRFDILVVVE